MVFHFFLYSEAFYAETAGRIYSIFFPQAAPRQLQKHRFQIGFRGVDRLDLSFLQITADFLC